MNPEKNLTEKESFELISRMIQSSKETLGDDGTHYMIWGWGVLIAALAQFMMLRADFEFDWMAWAILMPLCGVIALIAGYRKEKKTRVRTFVESYLGYLWLSFIISMAIILTFLPSIGAAAVYPIIIVLYGIGTFVSGGALKFMPLKAGGIICWILALIAIRTTFEYQLLLIAASVVVAYLIPGYLLKQKYHSQLNSAL